ncbi:pilin [Streptomyces sp. NPDC046805]|uniref:pilin n=1 Tax=Streptomyces sp. NPDC046805 TaxID=3155134 RepID=UPI0033ED8635
MRLIPLRCRRARTPADAEAHRRPEHESHSGWLCRGLLLIGLTALVLAVVVSSAHAAEPDHLLGLEKSVNAVLDNIRNWIMGILAGLATVFLSVGGVRYVMAGGDPGEVEKAKTAFKSASWGYALAALAPLVVEILKGIVGA